ncbi:alanine--tRNA ligase [Thiohalospira sp.]|uniref:alanine--tRNA ligase n=1 Tax=Thiohalospira sp. TaxID=3080549 RepID=UPI0039800B08
MRSADIRQTFLDFFAERGHQVVPSSPLVPENDPTLLFVNAGMVQFKETFLGHERRGYTRAVSSQRCVRAGGKHNDLENVGYTARHHTFFEMLGNFSFGDYFKREAIRYAWDLLTGPYGLPPERLWVTVYVDDDEAARIWLDEIGVDPARFSRIDGDDNFWSMGDTGPCGPCSEIFYDHGPEVPGGPPGTPEEDGDRYVEIWNLVFMQYDRQADGTMTELPHPSVDTGMGLERLAAVLQGYQSNYDIDLFRHLMEAAAEAAGVAYERDNSHLKVIADHIRSVAFLIVDGVLPSNEGRGYVLRRIIRRAIRHGFQLGTREPFFHRMVAPLVAEMGEAYPELAEQADRVARILEKEEQRFAETLDAGMKHLEEAFAGLEGDQLDGEVVFRLYDTYGFPADLTADIARERGVGVDIAGFEQHMEAQRERARAAGQFGIDYHAGIHTEAETEFLGYDALEAEGTVVALFRGSEPVDRLEAGEEGAVVLDRTPFYGESGGQVGDTGALTGSDARFEVRDTQKAGNAHVHVGTLKLGQLAVGDTVRAGVTGERRASTAHNHSATHLLHAALRRVLGDHVQQKGSLVEPERLRFDFSHEAPLTADEIAEIEGLVNGQIRANTPVHTRVTSMDEARRMGAVALFGEKYGDTVRVLSMGEDDFSVELCGGTHVARTGDIGLFKIVEEAGVSAGVRRIEAVTGEAAFRRLEEAEATLGRLAEKLKTDRNGVEARVEQLQERLRAAEKEAERLKDKLASSQGADLADQAEEMAGVKVLAARLEGADPKALRSTVDQLKQKLGSGVIVLGVPGDGKVNLAAGVTDDLTDRIAAGELVNHVAAQVGGKGGGRADFAQAGGSQPEALGEALDSVRGWVAERLG